MRFDKSNSWHVTGLLLATAVFAVIAQEVRIGGIFHEGDEEGVRAFNFAIQKVNEAAEKDPSLMTLDLDIRYTSGNSTINTTEEACSQLERGINAFFGPSSGLDAYALRSIANLHRVPLISVDWAELIDQRGDLTVNFYPSLPKGPFLGKAILDLALELKWRKLVVVYEEDAALIRLAELLHHSAYVKDSSTFTVSLMKMKPDQYRRILKSIKFSGFNFIVVDCKRDSVPYLLENMLELQMLAGQYHYVFTSLDLFSMDLARYSEGGAKLAVFHLVDNNHEYSLDIMDIWRENSIFGPFENDTDYQLGGLSTQSALTYDAVHALSYALSSLNISRDVTVKPMSCDNVGKGSANANGVSLYDSLTNVNFDGLTGRVNFTNGLRSSPHLHLSTLVEGGLQLKGSWNNSHGIYMIPPSGNATINFNRTLRVTTVLERPYVMLRETEDGMPLAGNDQYEGYCIDLIRNIAEIVGFKYKIHLVADGDYGSEDPETGEWNGMVGEIMRGEADLAVAPLTISFVREEVIDFSKPFMYLGLTILYRFPEPQNPGVFSFLNPLAFDVWMYVVMAYLAVSLTVFLLARFSPYEWYNSHPCNPEYDQVENQFNLLSCMWFAFGGLMQQGSELNPKAFSTRVLSGFWWFFSLILVSSYTANLAAFLTIERMVSPIQSADDLAKQTEIQYGTRKGGSTETFFKRSDIPTYSAMWQYMSSRPSVFSDTYSSGIERVLKNKDYAFLMESTMAEYVISQYCRNLTQIGGLLNSRGYGIGVPRGSPIRDEITSAILKLQEDDVLLRMKNTWWKHGKCVREESSKEDANELGVENIGGIFLVLAAGLIIGILVAIGEFIWKSKQNAEIDRKSLCGEMMAGLRFACRCNGRKKPAPSMFPETKYQTPFTTTNGQMISLSDNIHMK